MIEGVKSLTFMNAFEASSRVECSSFPAVTRDGIWLKATASGSFSVVSAAIETQLPGALASTADVTGADGL